LPSAANPDEEDLELLSLENKHFEIQQNCIIANKADFRILQGENPKVELPSNFYNGLNQKCQKTICNTPNSPKIQTQHH
jgi:hypothetical protein